MRAGTMADNLHQHPKLKRLRKLNRNIAAKRLQQERGGEFRPRVISKKNNKSLTKRQLEELQNE